jgi:Protein of unknown function (DUF998)
MRSARSTLDVVGRSIWLARGVVLGQVLFTAGWVIGSLLQGHAYSSARHDISDLGALTAQAPWTWLIPQGTAGVLTIVFALGALKPALRAEGRRGPMSAWLVAFSLMGLDNVSDVVFRLDCRAADPGCTPAVAAASWSGSIHMIMGLVTALLTVAAPFALARRMRVIPEWRDLVPGTIAVGVLFALLTAIYVTLNGAYGQGYAQRASCLLISAGIVILARRVLVVARTWTRPTSTGADGGWAPSAAAQL